jgi:hypothetical protein
MLNLVSPFLEDSFSTSLRILSYHLKELTLLVQADKTLFWPKDTSIPMWPDLEAVFIIFHMVSPSGAWYFEGPTGEGRHTSGYEVNEVSYPPLEHTDDDEGDDWDVEDGERRSYQSNYDLQFRILPNEAVVRLCLANFARAAANMPKLKQAVLWSPLRWDIWGSDDGTRELFLLFDNQVPYNYRQNLAWGLAYYKPNYCSYFTKKPAEFFSSARRIW